MIAKHTYYWAYNATNRLDNILLVHKIYVLSYFAFRKSSYISSQKLIEDITLVKAEDWDIFAPFDVVEEIFKLLATDVKGNPCPTFQFN